MKNRIKFLSLCLFLSACASAKTQTDVAPEPIAPPQVSQVVAPEPAKETEEVSEAEKAILEIYSVGGTLDREREAAYRAMYDAIREHIFDKCTFGGCSFTLPSYETFKYDIVRH